jgi:hypothetical protein
MTPAGRNRIMVTGVGGAPGFDLAVGLLRRGIDVIGLDADPLAPGLLIPSIIPRATCTADSPGYPAELLGLCAELRPVALFSTVEHELPALIRMRHDLAGLGVRTWLPDLDGARACLDKAAFCAALVRDGLPVPRTWLPHEIAQVPDGAPNDNPYSESAFKTLKYCPAFPGQFGSIQDANSFCEAFFTYYNTEHRHSGIAMHTPSSVHDGSWVHVQARRAATLQAAYEAHPERFRGRCPQPRPLPDKVWINEPPATIETANSLQTTQAA